MPEKSRFNNLFCYLRLLEILYVLCGLRYPCVTCNEGRALPRDDLDQ